MQSQRITAAPAKLKRSGLHRLECAMCATYVYATVAQLEQHGMPLCPVCQQAFEPERIELALMLGRDDAPVVVAWRDLTQAKMMSQDRSLGHQEVLARISAGTLNRMDARALDEIREAQRKASRARRIAAIMPVPEPLPF